MSTVDPDPRPGARELTRDGVVRAARDLVAQDGFEALTMRRLASRCGVGTMTLYRHTRTKEELLGALADLYLDDVVLPEPGGSEPWQERLVAVFREVRRVFLVHPELPRIAATQSLEGTVAFRGAEVVLSCLAEGGVTGPTAVAVFDAMTLFTIGFAQREAAARDDPEARTRRMAAILTLPADRFPHLLAEAPSMVGRTDEDHFDAGLGLIVAGLRPAAG